jgi:hypothetical protein
MAVCSAAGAAGWQPQSAHRSPSTCAAREWPQWLQRLSCDGFSIPLSTSKSLPKFVLVFNTARLARLILAEVIENPAFSYR